jgi:glycosyltransferase involved in cell wall biosynthesis
MKLLLGCDAHIFQYNEKFYIRNFFSNLFDKYFISFDSIKLIARVCSIDKLNLEDFSELDTRIELIQLPFFRGISQFLSNYNKIKTLLSYVDVDFSVSILRLPSLVSYVSYIFLLKGKNIPIGIEIVANPLELSKASDNLFTKFFYYIFHIRLLNICKVANGIAYVSKMKLPELYKSNKTNAFYSYYSSITLDGSFYYKARKFKKKKEYLICHVANNISSKSKGHEILIHAISILKTNGYSNLKVKFIGDGSYVERFIKLSNLLNVQDSISFIGYLDKSSLKKILIESDLMIFPSKSEGLPRVIIEAMATGLPCIASNVGGIPELLSKDMIVKFNTPKEYANKIVMLLSNAELYNAESEFNFKRSFEYENIYLQKQRMVFFEQLKQL